MQKLIDSGYSEAERLTILKGGFKTHENLKNLEITGKRKNYKKRAAREKKKKKS